MKYPLSKSDIWMKPATYRNESRGGTIVRYAFIPASNEPSGCLQTFGDCREGQSPPLLCSGGFDLKSLQFDVEKNSAHGV